MMTVTDIPRSYSPLDAPPSRFARRPFYAETLTLLRGVRDGDLETLSWLCDDDYGIVDSATRSSSSAST